MKTLKIISTLLIAWGSLISVNATIVYQDDFSGAAGPVSGSVREVSPGGFVAFEDSVALDGNGKMVTTAVTPGSYYRFRLGTEPLTSNPVNETISYTVVMRVPEEGNGDYIGIGFQGENATGFLAANVNSGPWVQFKATSIVVQGGSVFDGASEIVNGAYSAGDTITAVLTYVISNQTVNLSVNGTSYITGFALNHEYPSGTPSDPIVYWAQIQMRNQDPSTGAYIDSFQVETTESAVGDVVYQDDFSGSAGLVSSSVREVTPDGFVAFEDNVALDGNGKIVTTSVTPGSYYRFRLGTAPLTDNLENETISYTVVMRVPEEGNSDYIGIGFQGDNATGFLSTSANAGPWVQFKASSIVVQGGGIFDGASETINGVYSAGDTITAVLTYVISNQTVSLSVNGSRCLIDFALLHEHPTGTSSDPVVYWAQIQMRNQDPSTGAYIDSFQVKTTSIEALTYSIWSNHYALVEGPSGDDDQDGINNLYEFGLGGNPTNSADRGISPVFDVVEVGGTSYFGYVHPQLSDPNSGLTYYLELCTNLVSGTWTNAGYNILGTNVTGGDLDMVTNYTDMVNDQKFIRLIIE